MTSPRTASEMLAAIDVAESDYEWGGDEDADGNLLPGFVNFDTLRAVAERIDSRERELVAALRGLLPDDAGWNDDAEWGRECAYNCKFTVDSEPVDGGPDVGGYYVSHYKHADDCPVTRARLALAAYDSEKGGGDAEA